MDQQGQTHSPVPTAADRPATPDLAAGGNFRLVCPDGRQLAGNVILHSGGRIYTDMVPLQNRSWSPLATVPDAILCGGVTWARTENDFVTANLGALSAQRFRPQVIRQNRLAAAPWRSTARLTRQQPVHADRRSFEIVIARYREDTAWADCYPHNATIYCKDPNHQDPRFIPLPNIGREYGTYLHHIVSRYDSLAERTLFVQGDPFFHRLPPIEDFAFAKEDFMSLVNMHHSMAQAVNWGWPDQTVDGAVKTEFLRLLECPTDFHRFSFTWGAQFVVTRTLLQRRPKSYFQKLYAISQLPEITLCGRRFDNLHIGFMFEFFWENIFRGEAMPNPDAVPAGRRGVGALGEREITAGHLV